MLSQRGLWLFEVHSQWTRICLTLIFALVSVFLACDEKPTKINRAPSVPMISVSDTSVVSGETVDLYATATDPDGDPLTYYWTKTSGSFDTSYGQTVVWTAPATTNTRIDTVSVQVSDNHGATTSNSINIIVNPVTGIVEGTATDETGAAIVGMIIAILPESYSTFLDTSVTDALGGYSVTLRPGTYNIGGQVVVGTKYLSSDHTDQVNVLGGDTITHNINARNGYFLKLSNIDLNGSGDSVTVLVGEGISLNCTYTIWSRKGCPACIDWIAVGIEADGQDAYSVGIPGIYPGENGSASLLLTAPNTSGTYTVYGIVAPDYTEQAAITRYETYYPDENCFIPIGIVIVQ